jgi:hypothetical protein
MFVRWRAPRKGTCVPSLQGEGFEGAAEHENLFGHEGALAEMLLLSASFSISLFPVSFCAERGAVAESMRAILAAGMKINFGRDALWRGWWME